MRAIYLSDEDFAEVHGALTAAMDGQDVLIAMLSNRFGADSDQVAAERARLARMEEADRSLRGVSSWRSGGDKNPRRRKQAGS